MVRALREWRPLSRNPSIFILVSCVRDRATALITISSCIYNSNPTNLKWIHRHDNYNTCTLIRLSGANLHKIQRLIFHYISLEKKTFLQITGQYLYYHNSQKFWRNYITTDWTSSLINVTYSVQVSMGLDLACQQLRLF